MINQVDHHAGTEHRVVKPHSLAPAAHQGQRDPDQDLALATKTAGVAITVGITPDAVAIKRAIDPGAGIQGPVDPAWPGGGA